MIFIYSSFLYLVEAGHTLIGALETKLAAEIVQLREEVARLTHQEEKPAPQEINIGEHSGVYLAIGERSRIDAVHGDKLRVPQPPGPGPAPQQRVGAINIGRVTATHTAINGATINVTGKKKNR